VPSTAGTQIININFTAFLFYATQNLSSHEARIGNTLGKHSFPKTINLLETHFHNRPPEKVLKGSEPIPASQMVLLGADSLRAFLVLNSEVVPPPPTLTSPD
jgi:hypothetical protein